MNVSLIIKAIDQASGPLRRVTAATRELGQRGLGSVTRSAAAASSALKGVANQRFAVVRAGLRNLATGSLAFAERAAFSLGRALGSAAGGAAILATRLGAGVVAAGAYAIGRLASDVISTASSFEQMETQLVGLEGSSARARASMDWIGTFATETPYKIDEVTKAFVRARGLGIDPMNGSLRSMGDAAAGNGKTLIDAIEAVGDAQTNEYERLKEFQITSSSKGGTVAFSYLDKQGKQAVKTTRKNARDIQTTLLGIFDEKYAGNMARQSKTMTGIVSNIGDAWTRFKVKIAKAGIFDFAKKKLGELLAKLGELEKNGTLDRWAKNISDWMKGAGQSFAAWAEGVDWEKTAKNIGEIASAIGDVIKFVARAIGWIGKLVDGLQSLQAWSKKTDSKVYTWLTAPAGYGRGVGNAGRQAAQAAAAKSVQPSGPPVKTRGYGRAGAGMQVPVGGKISLDIRTDKGTTARVSGMKSANANVPIEVRQSRGPVSAAA